MEEKFIEEFNKAFEEKKLLHTKYKKSINKNCFYYLLSGIPFLYFYDTSFLLAILSSSPIYLYGLKNMFKFTYKDIKLEFNIREKFYIEETTCYKEVLKEYREIILRLSDLFDKNKVNSLVDIQSSFVFMQKNGYLSENHIWKYKNLIDKMYLKNKGISIIGGYGVCRDLSRMLNDLLKNMNFYTVHTSIIMDWIEEYETLHSFDSIEYLCKNLNIDMTCLVHLIKKIDDDYFSEYFDDGIGEIRVKNVFNHSIVSTENNGKVYHFDPTNHLYFKNFDKKHITFYEEEYPLKVSFREYRKEKKHLLGLPNPDKEEIYNLYNEYYIKNLLEREKLYQKFYEDNKESYQRINEKVKIINKHWK